MRVRPPPGIPITMQIHCTVIFYFCIMQNEKTKTIINLIKFIDQQLEIVVSENVPEVIIEKALCKMNMAYSTFEYLYRPYLGVRTPLRRKENEIKYNYNHVLFCLTPFQEQLFTKLEKEALSYRKYQFGLHK